MNPNLSYLKKISDIPDASFNKLQEIAVYKFYNKKTTISASGDVPSKVYYIVSGIIRAYFLMETGKEYNKRLYAPYSFAGALTSIITDKPSEVSFETLTDCKLYEIDFAEFKNLCRADMQIGKLYVKILEQTFIAYEDRSLDFMRLSATEQYIKLRKTIKGIDELIPQYQIASYLGITPVQLSRIRRKIENN